MTPEEILALLNDVAGGKRTPADALTRLANMPYEDLEFAKLDHHRLIRRGFPETVFAQGKTVDDLLGILERLRERGAPILATRVGDEAAAAAIAAFPDLTHTVRARTLHRGEMPRQGRGAVLVLTAGTSDIPVAEEAAITARVFGNEVEVIHDVGVAGIHRLMAARDAFRRASVIIVAAGMEGALASVVAGLVAAPVIGVPTSIGYGADFGGVAPLLSMLNSCAGGLSVVNIDNGYGAAVVASLINRGNFAWPASGEGAP
ncbi:nickel pincer cofactor biosynthesis protein LarB [bacterium]|nr:nickel pincer cofactor biosynthesis protein LarB [bacterium]